MFGKLFASMYDGSLRSKGPWEAIVTLQQLVILADIEGAVDMNCEAISSRTSIPLPIIQKGIEALMAPDPDSRNPGEDGRRIVLLRPHNAWGWRIVNYGFYRNLRSEEERRVHRREYHREYARKRRQQPVNKSQHSSNGVNGVTPSRSRGRSKGITTTTKDPRALAVFTRYKELFPDSRLSLPAASKVITPRLVQYSEGELIRALEGNAADPWHVERGKHELSYILRNSDKIDLFRQLRNKQEHPKLVGVGGDVTVDELEQMGIRL